jgi:N-acetylneuraminic acid mutarotase
MKNANCLAIVACALCASSCGAPAFERFSVGAVEVDRSDGVRLLDHGVRLPASLTDEGIVFDGAIEVIEEGASGKIEPGLHSVELARVDGRSYFTSQGGALEEWCDVATSDGRVELRWQVRGGQLVRSTTGVVVVANAGSRRYLVDAPSAEGASGQQLVPSIDVDGDRIVVRVDAHGETSVLVDPIWRVMPSLPQPLSGMGLTVLPNGKLMTFGGYRWPPPFTTATNVYDPSTGSWSAGPNMPVERQGPLTVVLETGKVLICGGSANDGSQRTDCNLYDPVANAFSTAASMLNTACGATNTLLVDGRVLIVGNCGCDATGCWPIAQTQIYDPVLDQWSYGPPPIIGHFDHAAVRMQDNRVMIAGGYTDSSDELIPDAEIFDPTNNAWTDVATFPVECDHPTLTALPSGLVLANAEGEAFTYNAGTNVWTFHGQEATPRAAVPAVLVPNGNVEFAGGETGGSPFNNVDEYNSSTNSWSAQGTMPTALYNTGVAVEPNGRVLYVGGEDNVNGASAAVSTEDVNVPALVTTASMPHNHAAAAAVLRNGSAMIIGGSISAGVATSAVDAWSGAAWSSMPSLVLARMNHTATLLPNNHVVVIGGNTGSGTGSNKTEVFNGTSWTTVAKGGGVFSHTATLLDDGRILVAGGCSSTNVKTNQDVIYDPALDSWKTLAPLQVKRCGHTAVLLSSKRVLLVGGDGLNPSTAEIVDVVAGTTTLTSAMPAVHDQGATATLLQNGRALVTGGSQSNVTSNRADVYDEVTNVWTFATTLKTARAFHTATPLVNGRVALIGGTTKPSLVEEYDPETAVTINDASTGTFYQLQSTSTLLLDGRVLFAGGYSASGTTPMNEAGRFDEGRNSVASLVPAVTSIAGAPTPGGSVSVTGVGLMGMVGDQGMGGVGFSVSTALPLFSFERIDGGGLFYATTTAFAPSSARMTVPANAARGAYVLRVVTHGVPSAGIPVNLQ